MDRDIKKLTTRLKAGDKNAFDELFKLYYKRILSFCMKYFYSREDAEGITQEIFVKVWLNRDNIKSDKNFMSYLFTMTKNFIINDIKHKIRLKSRREEYLSNINQICNPVEEEMIYKELEEIFQRAVLLLPKRRKEIFLMSREEGLSTKEIAEKLHLSLKTVEAQIHLTLKYLKTILKKSTA